MDMYDDVERFKTKLDCENIDFKLFNYQNNIPRNNPIYLNRFKHILNLTEEVKTDHKSHTESVVREHSISILESLSDTLERQ